MDRGAIDNNVDGFLDELILNDQNRNQHVNDERDGRVGISLVPHLKKS